VLLSCIDQGPSLIALTRPRRPSLTGSQLLSSCTPHLLDMAAFYALAAGAAAATVNATGPVYTYVRDKQIDDLSTFCKKTAKEAVNKNPGCNVLVYQDGFECDMSDLCRKRNPIKERYYVIGTPRCTKFWVHIMEQGKTYRFTKYGDGGYCNWCIRGRINRNGDDVTFY